DREDRSLVSFVIPNSSSSPAGRTVALSPTGSVIATGQHGAPLTRRRVTDFGSSTVLTPTAILQPFFSSDGQSVGYFDGVDQNIMRIPVEGGTPTLVARGTGARALGRTWGRDGTIIFATTSGLYRVTAAGEA